MLVSSLEARLETCFVTMSKIAWVTFDEVGDQSAYPPPPTNPNHRIAALHRHMLNSHCSAACHVSNRQGLPRYRSYDRHQGVGRMIGQMMAKCILVPQPHGDCGVFAGMSITWARSSRTASQHIAVFCPQGTNLLQWAGCCSINNYVSLLFYFNNYVSLLFY